MPFTSYEPKCPKCGGTDFVAINKEVKNSEQEIALIVCEAEECQAVIGVLPSASVWHGSYTA